VRPRAAGRPLRAGAPTVPANPVARKCGMVMRARCMHGALIKMPAGKTIASERNGSAAPWDRYLLLTFIPCAALDLA